MKISKEEKAKRIAFNKKREIYHKELVERLYFFATHQ